MSVERFLVQQPRFVRDHTRGPEGARRSLRSLLSSPIQLSLDLACPPLRKSESLAVEEFLLQFPGRLLMACRSYRFPRSYRMLAGRCRELPSQGTLLVK